MADKRPFIHPFFMVKKKKQTESTEGTKPTADLSASINNCNNVNIEEIPDKYTSLIIVDDALEEDVSSSLVNDQSEKQLSKCDLVCCTSSRVYVPVIASDLQLTSIKGLRSCQESWFKIFS
ncbi:unnamed protein product [Rotaria magnacalcarata]|uniref:Uncharacterized protein n=1 Tax=Rotaria magnacalcarata TaxID=392030 RepID=A0A815YQK2_9BILA|nr:unnamed protein product [Rotaria magnacalcarata]